MLTALPPQVLDLMAVGTHGHTDFPQNPTCSGTQTLTEFARSAQHLGFAAFAVTEHTTDPGAIQRDGHDISNYRLFADNDPLTAIILGHNDEIRAVAAAEKFNLLTGIEANIVGAFGQNYWGIDAPAAVLRDCDYVVASFHGAPEHNPERFERRLLAACQNPYVHSIGHPTRNTHLAKPDWAKLLPLMKQTGTAFGLNVNQWFKETGQGTPVPATDSVWGQWKSLIQLLVEVRLWLVIELDIHNSGMWPTSEPTETWHTTVARLIEFLDFIQHCGVDSKLIVNADEDRFNSFCQVDKAARQIA